MISPAPLLVLPLTFDHFEPFPPPPVFDIVARCLADTSRSVAESLRDVSGLYYMRDQNQLLLRPEAPVLAALADEPEILLPLMHSQRILFLPRPLYMRLLVDLLLDTQRPSAAWNAKVLGESGDLQVSFQDGLFFTHGNLGGKKKGARLVMPPIRGDEM